MHSLIKESITTIATALLRATVNAPSDWATRYRVMGPPIPGPYTFKYHPWAREMHDCDAPLMVGQKGAQLGFTEVALNKAFYTLDQLHQSVLYILPAQNPDAHDFSKARFDPALEQSPYLRTLFSDVRNVGHKRAGSANLFIRGSRSRSQLKSLPVSLLIADELDEMDQDNVILALERLSGQFEKQAFFLSTPTIDGVGINKWYQQSDQRHYFFPCPHCNRLIELIYPDSLVITAEDLTDPNIVNSHLICLYCKHPLDHEAKPTYLNHPRAGWVPAYTDRPIAGYHVNQLYSATVTPVDIAKAALTAETNPAAEQEFYNSKLGLTHVVKGARVLEEDIEKCIKGYKMVESIGAGTKIITIGIDVGTWLHIEVDEWTIDESKFTQTKDLNLAATPRVINTLKYKDFNDLNTLITRYNPHFIVIDANPERRAALTFAQQHWGRVKLCFYGAGVNGKTIHTHTDEEHTITVDRTTWLDLSLGRFKTQTIELPLDIPLEYRQHILAPVRTYKKDRLGMIVGRYVSATDDHFAHARNYAEIALQFAVAMNKNKNIVGVW